MTARRGHGGFTLVEVLVALFVVALGMGALMATLASSADAVGRLRERSLAQWIALNRVSETRLAAMAPARGKTEGEIDYAGGRWQWRQEVVDPGIAGILRIEVSVSHAGDAPDAVLASAAGFYGVAVALPSGQPLDWSAASTPVVNPAERAR